MERTPKPAPKSKATQPPVKKEDPQISSPPKPKQKTTTKTCPPVRPSDSIPTSIRSSSISKTGMSPENPRKTNQDSFLIIQNFTNIPDCHLFGVFDGHGQYGGEISSFIKDRLPVLLSSPPFPDNIPAALSSSLQLLQSEILKKKYDTSLSGSTLNLVVLFNNRLFCANVGDSRAVLGRRDPRKWIAIDLSRDHKPTIPEEKKRIEISGGRVEAFLDENGEAYGPARVWVKGLEFPGIAVSRTMGDSIAASIGVICEPEIRERSLQQVDKFILLGSDGLFEFISNEEMVSLASGCLKGKDPEAVCNYLVRVADERWRMEEESVDDITCVCVLLEYD